MNCNFTVGGNYSCVCPDETMDNGTHCVGKNIATSSAVSS